jgi:hypothetical protein
MVVLMVTTLALSCFTSCWVSMRPDYKVLKRYSKSSLWVWAMRMGELKRGGVGSNFFPKNAMDESDMGKEMNPME